MPYDRWLAPLFCLLIACEARVGPQPEDRNPRWDAGVADDASPTNISRQDSGVEAGVGAVDASDADVDVDVADASGPERVIDWQAVEAVLAEIRAGERYQRPTPQDSEGHGIYPAQGATDGRSERVLPPFIMGPRRQTDSMVRQLYSLLPIATRRSLAFVIPDRIAQDPDVYIPYLRSRRAVHVVGNFVGIGQASKDEAWFVARHDTELWMAKVTIKLALALGLEVKSVRYTMGDSSSSYASSVRETLQTRLHGELSMLGLEALNATITFGADEAVPVALAVALPDLTIRIHYTKGDARHHYDGNKTSRQVIAPKLAELGLKEVSSPADLELWVLDNVTGDDGTLPDQAAQRNLDQQAVMTFEALDVSARRKLVIVDGRMFNGALDAYGAPHDCNMLAYGA